jgi:MFS transporter, SHS family, lactate transporter
MSYAASSRATGPWWREPTKDQWFAFVAAWLGWTLDAVVTGGMAAGPGE